MNVIDPITIEKSIRREVNVTDAVYQELYFYTLCHVKEFCQNHEHNECNVLWLKQLQQALSALKIIRGKLLPKNTPIEIISREAPKWTFAIFTYYLFSGLSKEFKLDNAVSAKAITWLKENQALFSQWQSAINNPSPKNVFAEIFKTPQKNISKSNKAAAMMIPKSVQSVFNYLLKRGINDDLSLIRTEEGLFVRNKVLNDFLTNNRLKWNGFGELVDAIKPALKEDSKGSYCFEYRSKAFEDRAILEGVIFKEEYLISEYKKQPINKKFQLAIQL